MMPAAVLDTVPTPHTKTDRPCAHRVHQMSCAEFRALEERAAGRCELCALPREATGGRRLVIDHFESNTPRLYVVRGLICDRCNSVMARFDGNQPWGASRAQLEGQAAAYQARSWQIITEEERELMEMVQERQRERCAERHHRRRTPHRGATVRMRKTSLTSRAGAARTAPVKLHRILARRLAAGSEAATVTVTADLVPYLEGLADGGVDGAAQLAAALAEHGQVEVKIA